MVIIDHVTKYYMVNFRKKVVLDDVSVAFNPNRSYGLLGQNGAGKSTFLRLVAGAEEPNKGRIWRNTRISWPLGFSGSFHPKMTGRENAIFLARVYGADLKKTLDFVYDFAELGPDIDAPVGTYSSGMSSRLAFAISMAVEFDVYLVDETTAVGDSRFQQRCAAAFAERRARSGMIMVSHSVATIKEYCDTGMILANGKLLMFDDLNEAIERYRQMSM
ncbi:ABC transporter ATP-binding protein [Ancylobacter oerskovii]|uniref:ABC transporter ATP-binding protein n=1 Tax=Ancylobacter oerskovii TaxID=459519 RepID=A0ABW4YVY4_9HYPH|nr:ABC transporter ATP-binding protein [Ancylobacter oerskovii]MBS7544281.1 ABC transporter ATP-binding protein [Ancylobacter oerskovii]